MIDKKILFLEVLATCPTQDHIIARAGPWWIRETCQSADILPWSTTRHRI